MKILILLLIACVCGSYSTRSDFYATDTKSGQKLLIVYKVEGGNND